MEQTIRPKYDNDNNYSVIIIHLCKNPSNNEYNVLMSLSSKYLEFVPIGGCCKKNILSKIHNQSTFYKQILLDGLRETKEETMDLINDRYHSILFENEQYTLYQCTTKDNTLTKYLLFKQVIDIQFTNCTKRCYFIIHYIDLYSNTKNIEFNQYQRRKMIYNIKNRRKHKLYDIPMYYKNNTLIQKLNDLYVFEKGKNDDCKNRKLYISPYLETLELKWFPITNFFNDHQYDFNLNRIYDNKELYHHLFYSNWEDLINYINTQRINIDWLLQYLNGKTLSNRYIINKYYKTQIVNFLYYNKNSIINMLL